MPADPPDDPLGEPRRVGDLTPADVTRLAAIRRVAPWYREPAVIQHAAGPEDDAAFLLSLVDRLLGRAPVPGEDLYRDGEPDDGWTVTSGPSLYMCGHGDWHVHRRGRPGIVLSFTGGPLDAARLRALANGRNPLDHRPEEP